jgi:MoaA/NifB/PqqE/SkfB family radical SAM enzyme
MIPRVIFNFTGRCNMQCPFCYIPFDGALDSIQGVTLVFSTMLARLQPYSVTIGGGDPLMYRDLSSILEMARAKTRFVQLDTNAKGLRRDRMYNLAKNIDLLGLPLESAQAEIHDRLREEPGHYDRVLGALACAREFSVPVKINTVVTAENVQSIAGLGALIQASGATRWSLYEFWRMEPVPGPSDRFIISEADFASAIEEARRAAPNVRVEGGSSVSSRTASYVFVRHTGGVYVVDRHDSSKYVELGSIFDDGIVERLSPEFDSAQQRARLSERMEP